MEKIKDIQRKVSAYVAENISLELPDIQSIKDFDYKLLTNPVIIKRKLKLASQDYTVVLAAVLFVLAVTTVTIKHVTSGSDSQSGGVESAEAVVENVTEVVNITTLPPTILEERANLLSQKCKSYKIKNFEGYKLRSRTRHKNFIMDAKNNILFCPVFRSGSIIFLQTLCLMNEMKITKLKGLSAVNEIEFLPHLTETIPKSNDVTMFESFDSAVRIILVRSPLERLVDVYKDITERTSEEMVNARKMIQENREEAGDGGSEKLSFPQFVRYLKASTSELQVCEGFTKMWCPFTFICEPCFMDFQHIIKMENIKTDLPELEKKSIISSVTPNLNKLFKENRDTFKESKDFYPQLTEEELEFLCTYYKDDFKFFKYSCVPFRKMLPGYADRQEEKKKEEKEEKKK